MLGLLHASETGNKLRPLGPMARGHLYLTMWRRLEETYLILHFEDRRGTASLRYRNRAEIAVAFFSCVFE